MYVCVCKGITRSQITQAIADGAGSYAQVREQLGVGTCCGLCAVDAKHMVRDELQSQFISKETAAIAARLGVAA